MKKFTLFFLGFFIILSAYTQNPYAVLYSELGERFTVYIDGNAQHQYPESNVKILDIQGTSHNVRIVFENGFIEEINKPLVLENGMESTFLIHKKSGRYDLSPKSQIPLAQASRVANAKAQTVVTYRGATQNTNTNVSMNTTSTGSGADGGGSVNVNINVSTGGNNPSGNVSVTSSGTGTTDTKPASDSYGAGQSSGKGQGKADKPKDNNTTDSYGQGKGQGKGHAKGHDKDHGKADKPKDNTSSSAAAGSAKDNTSSSAVAGGAKDNTSSSSAAASSGNNQGSVSVSVNTSQSGQASGGKSEAEINHGNHVTGKPNPNSNDNNAGGKPMSGNLVHGTKIGVKNQTSNPSSNQSVVPGYSGKINCNKIGRASCRERV